MLTESLWCIVALRLMKSEYKLFGLEDEAKLFTGIPNDFWTISIYSKASAPYS